MSYSKYLKINQLSAETKRRFMAFIDKCADGCWLWRGHTDKGYGIFAVNSRPVLAHRFAYALFVGEIPAGMCICHSCDNSRCVNPDHLFIGSHRDNMNDMVAKGRVARGARHGNVKLSADTVRAIRLYARIGINDRFIARRLGVPLLNTRAIIARRTWKHIP